MPPDSVPAQRDRVRAWFGPPGNLILIGFAAFFMGLAIVTAFGSGEPWIVGPCAYLGGVLQVLAIARASQ